MSAKSDQWNEAKRRCRLSDEEIRMARELGMQPRSLIENIPSPSKQWKAPVKEWVRSLHQKKFGERPPPVRPTPALEPAEQPRVLEFRDPAWPWPDRPEIPDLIVDMNEDLDDSWGPPRHPSEEKIAETTSRMIRNQYRFRWGAQSVARAMNSLDEVRTVAAFGAVAQPLRMEVPRFSEFRRFRIPVPHECQDLDLAVWLNHFDGLRALKNALANGVNLLRDSPYCGLAHHQVDVHVFDAATGRYGGRLCIFGQCPKPRKRQCLVPGCGRDPFLQQFDDYRFDHARFEREPKVILLDRAVGFLVHEPLVVDVNPAKIIEWTGRDEEDEDDDEDAPF